MKRSRRRAAVLGGCGAFAGLLLIADDAALLIASVVLVGAWVRLVLGDGERELQRFERLWAPLLDPRDRGDT
jgi:hypothetical protein